MTPNCICTKIQISPESLQGYMWSDPYWLFLGLNTILNLALCPQPHWLSSDPQTHSYLRAFVLALSSVWNALSQLFTWMVPSCHLGLTFKYLSWPYYVKFLLPPNYFLLYYSVLFSGSLYAYLFIACVPHLNVKFIEAWNSPLNSPLYVQ